MSRAIKATITVAPQIKHTAPYSDFSGQVVFIPVNEVTAVVPDPYTGGCVIYTRAAEFRVDEYTHMIINALGWAVVDVNDYDEVE